MILRKSNELDACQSKLFNMEKLEKKLGEKLAMIQGPKGQHRIWVLGVTIGKEHQNGTNKVLKK
jgi:hypothetical protein